MGTGLDAEFLRQCSLRPPDGVQCVGLSPAAGQRFDEQAPRALAGRISHDQRLQRSDHVLMPAARQFVDEGLLADRELQLVELGGKCHGGRIAVEMAHRLTPEPPLRLFEVVGGIGEPLGCDGRAGRRELALDQLDVDVDPRPQRVAAIDPHDSSITQHQPDAMDLALQRLPRRRRWPLTPDGVDHDVIWHAAAARSHQPFEDLPLPRRERQHAVAVDDIERPQRPHLHGGGV